MLRGFIGLFFLLVVPQLAKAETLEQAWARAYQTNPSLQAERASLRALDEQVAEARSNWRPSIDATSQIGATSQDINESQQFENSHFNNVTRGYGLQLKQPVFRGFRTDAETEAAQKQVFSGRAKLDATEEQLFIDTATAYLDVIRDLDILLVNYDSKNLLNDRFKEIKARSEQGDLTQTDVEQVQSRLERANVGRLQIEKSLAADRANFQRLTGMPPEKLDEPSIASEKENLDSLLQIVKKNNPNIIAAKYTTEQADAEIDLNQGALLPEVNITGNAGRNWGQDITLRGREDSAQILLEATIPLYRSGADYAKTRAAEQVLTQKYMELEEVRHKIIESSTDYLQSLNIAKAAIDADEKEIAAAGHAFTGITEAAKFGTRTTIDLLNAEQELADAKIDLARSKHDYNLAILELKAAKGELTAEKLKLPVQIYDPKLHYNDVSNKVIGFSRDNSRYLVIPPENEKLPPPQNLQTN